MILMSSNWQLPRSDGRSGAGNQTHTLRYMTRIGMVAIIFVLAWFRGFNSAGMVYLAGVVAWAACLPLLTRGLANRLSSLGYSRDARRWIVIGVAILLLGVFAISARTVIGSG